MMSYPALRQKVTIGRKQQRPQGHVTEHLRMHTWESVALQLQYLVTP